MKVLIVGANTRSGLSMLRILARQGVAVIGADELSYPYGLHSKYTKKYYSYNSETGSRVFDSIRDILDREQPDVLIPMKCSRELHPYREQLEQFTRVLLPDPAGFRIADDNRLTLEECGKLGIPAPHIYELDEAVQILEENGASRLIVKPRKDVGGARGVHVVDNVDVLKACAKEVEHEFGAVVVEEYIPGQPHAMRSLNLLFDRSGELCATFTYRKIRQWPPSGGLVAHCASVHEPEVIATVLPFFEKWKWQGPVEVEYKWDSRDNTPKLIEINPRYSGNIAFAMTCGVPFALLHCMAALGQQVPEASLHDYQDGIKGIWPYYYLKSFVKEFKQSRHRSKLLARELAALRGTRFEILSNLSDMAPVMGFVLRVWKDRKKRGGGGAC